MSVYFPSKNVFHSFSSEKNGKVKQKQGKMERGSEGKNESKAVYLYLDVYTMSRVVLPICIIMTKGCMHTKQMEMEDKNVHTSSPSSLFYFGLLTDLFSFFLP